MSSRFHNPNSTSSVSDPTSPNYNPSAPNYDATRDSSSSTYIDRGSTSTTGEEAEQNAETQVNAETENGSWLDRLIDIFNHGNRVDETYRQDMTSQAEQLAQGIATRQGPMMMCSNYMANPHADLKTMVTEDVDPDAVGETGDMWISAGNAMTRFQNGVATAINSSEADWQGPAGDSARQFMASVGTWVGDAGQSAQLAGTQTNLQSSSLAEAKRNMPEPVDFDLTAANRDLQQTANPIELINKLNTYQKQYDAQQAAHQQAATVVNTYDSNLGTASTMPSFGAPPTMSSTGITAKVTKKPVDTVDTGDGTDSNTNNTQQLTNTNTDEGKQYTPPPTLTDPGDNDPNNPPGSNDNDPNNPNNPNDPNNPYNPYDPNTPTNPSDNVPGPTGPGQFPPYGPGGGNNNPGNNNPFVPPMPMTGPGPGGGGDYGRNGGGSGRYGGGPGGGFGGPGGSGSGAGSGSGMGRGGGMGSGFGPGGALAAEGAAMRGGAGGRGGGPGMMPMGAGNRSQGEDDDEHNRPSFLVEADPDAVFGTDEVTAPPVIGG